MGTVICRTIFLEFIANSFLNQLLRNVLFLNSIDDNGSIFFLIKCIRQRFNNSTYNSRDGLITHNKYVKLRIIIIRGTVGCAKQKYHFCIFVAKVFA